jgi:hypothetical protein
MHFKVLFLLIIITYYECFQNDQAFLNDENYLIIFENEESSTQVPLSNEFEEVSSGDGDEKQQKQQQDKSKFKSK